ncbi:hypothetical protein B0H13DRAFT_1853495 [Mycena leptocephala]|nr:hypothetical protein B0H13DRAFT_1853495 [Mycena leptocephala]
MVIGVANGAGEAQRCRKAIYEVSLHGLHFSKWAWGAEACGRNLDRIAPKFRANCLRAIATLIRDWGLSDGKINWFRCLLRAIDQSVGGPGLNVFQAKMMQEGKTYSFSPSSVILNAIIVDTELFGDGLTALLANHAALQDYSYRPDCFRHVAGKINVRCGALEMDEDERVKAAISMALCELATAAKISPLRSNVVLATILAQNFWEPERCEAACARWIGFSCTVGVFPSTHPIIDNRSSIIYADFAVCNTRQLLAAATAHPAQAAIPTPQRPLPRSRQTMPLVRAPELHPRAPADLANPGDQEAEDCCSGWLHGCSASGWPGYLRFSVAPAVVDRHRLYRVGGGSVVWLLSGAAGLELWHVLPGLSKRIVLQLDECHSVVGVGIHGLDRSAGAVTTFMLGGWGHPIFTRFCLGPSISNDETMQEPTILWLQNVKYFSDVEAASNLFYQIWIAQVSPTLVALISFYVQLFFCQPLWVKSPPFSHLVSMLIPSRRYRGTSTLLLQLLHCSLAAVIVATVFMFAGDAPFDGPQQR